MRLLLTVLLVMLACKAVAQTANVQTGEHSDFTRVVVTIPEAANWQLGRNEDGYLLRVPDIAGYDLRRFFDLIPRERILNANIGAQSNTLQLSVTCQCYVDAFVDRPGILVIDVRSGSAPANARFEQPLDPVEVFLAEEIEQRPTLPRFSVPERQLLPLIIPRNSAPESEPPTVISNSAPRVALSVTAPDRPNEEAQNEVEARNADLRALEQSITESLARGLSEGVLLPDIGQTNDVQANVAPQNVPSPGVETRTGIDLAAVPSAQQTLRTQEGQVCPADTFFDVANWGDDRPFSEQIGQLRSSFVGEFDRLDEASILATARLFVRFGFGREAAQTLQMDGVLSQERQYLLGIAQIMDEDPVSAGLFDKLVSCQSNVALWALLAADGGALDGAVDPAIVLRAFKALPSRLQSHLGPRLSERFLAIGDEESARQSLAKAISEPLPSTDAKLAEAELLQDLGETNAANETLTQLVREDNRTTPQTMTAFLKAAINEGIPVGPQDFLLADALRFEHEATAQAEELAFAQIHAYLHQGEFDLARQLIDELAPTIDPSALAEANNALAAAMLSGADDIRFLDFAFDDRSLMLNASIHITMAERLLDLGFPVRAVELLTVLEPSDQADIVQYLRAEAALMLGDAEGATQALTGLGTPQAMALADAAEAVALGNTFDRRGLPAATATTVSWRRGDWAALSSSSDPLLRDVSETILDDVPAFSQDAPLAAGLNLLERSAQSRDVVDRLLQRFETPADS
ncbi:MAG: hypothetical protein AAF801_09325 [Pseudomonadota bacterium]